MTDFCGMARQLWHIYVFHRTQEDFSRLYPMIDPQCVVIGTGKHEFYTSGEGLMRALNEECAQTENITFVLLDEWYQDCAMSPDAHLVYGGFHVRDGKDDAGMDMDVRFSVVYARRGQDWKIVHIHQSVPYKEQAYGEFYPKTLSERIRETQRLAARMAELANSDPVTGLYNHRAFFEQSGKRLAEGPAYLMVLDLDDFKNVNDTYGHDMGDKVLVVASLDSLEHEHLVHPGEGIGVELDFMHLRGRAGIGGGYLRTHRGHLIALAQAVEPYLERLGRLRPGHVAHDSIQRVVGRTYIGNLLDHFRLEDILVRLVHVLLGHGGLDRCPHSHGQRNAQAAHRESGDSPEGQCRAKQQAREEQAS